MGDHVKRDASKNPRIGIAPSVLSPAGLTVVSLAALAGGKAHAAVVYDNGSPDQVNASIALDQEYDVDFDHDGQGDCSFLQSPLPGGASALKISLEGAQLAEVVADGSGNPLAVSAGTLIGPNPSSGSFTITSGTLYNGTTPPVGYFSPGTPGYLGFEFTSGLDDSLHYGWVQFETTSGDPNAPTGTVIDFAYDDSPNTPIVAGAIPEPTSLSLLAAGAAGLAMYRGRRRA
jgi:hypothetical protein